MRILTIWLSIERINTFNLNELIEKEIEINLKTIKIWNKVFINGPKKETDAIDQKSDYLVFLYSEENGEESVFFS